ncbi:uncharacterized protein LOC143218187 [Lasioglossum baleicum]|uniref:uncharacterized protein LOC143218187 n=1 Tax=Lasioglossum baleicum TaxID=434251 RepID=UPI003FCDB0F4
MSPKRLNTSRTSRKPWHELGIRQKQRILQATRSNLISNNSAAPANVGTVQDSISSSSFVHNCIVETPREDSGSSFSIINFQNTSSSTSFSSIPSCDDTAQRSVSDLSFRDRLAYLFLQNNITHKQGNNILGLLRMHSCFHDLPMDTRTLLRTPRKSVITYKVLPGEYIHFDVKSKIVNYLRKSQETIPTHLQIDFNVDGCTLDKQKTVNFWPIQIRIANIPNSRPIIVGLYRGPHKPIDNIEYLSRFVSDINSIMSNGGIVFKGRKIRVTLRCFIADAPARAFILNHSGHTSRRPCSKCKVSGTRVQGRQVFLGTKHDLRTDAEYAAGTSLIDTHHKAGQSALASLPMGMVTCVPFDYMHLVLLGVVKKLISAWLCGNYSQEAQLSAVNIGIISARLNLINRYCPSDFARRPREIVHFSKYKATEFRPFLLYTGPVVTCGVMNETFRFHFLLLHAAIRILVSRSLIKKHITWAEQALEQFVHSCKVHYGETFCSYNVHGLLHLVADVKKYGPLDSFSAFAYENEMMFFKKTIRKHERPLQQVWNRTEEHELHDQCNEEGGDPPTDIRTPMTVSNSSGEASPHKIKVGNLLLSTNDRDNCCVLRDGTVCLISSIDPSGDSYKLGVKRFLSVHDFYDITIKSSALEFFECSNLSNDVVVVSVENVRAKCFRKPLFSGSENFDSELEITQWAVEVLAHAEEA